MKLLNLKLLFILLNIILSQCHLQNEAQFLNPLKNKKLQAPKQILKKGVKEIFCFGECLNAVGCHSINMHVEEKVCVMNYDVDDAEEAQFTEQDGWNYYQKSQVEKVYTQVVI